MLYSSVSRVKRVVVIMLALALISCSLPGLPIGGGGADQPTTEETGQQEEAVAQSEDGAATSPPAQPTVDVASLPPTNPQLVAQRPYPGEELPLDGSIDLYFDQPMNQNSVEKAIKTDPDLDLELTWVDDSTLRVTPKSGQLERAMHYTLTVEAGAESAEGLTFEDDTNVEVQTVGFLEVGEVVPAEDALAVEPDSVITVFFNRPVVPLVIVEDMDTLPQPLDFSPDIPGKGEWLNTSIYQWTPDEPLGGGQEYTVTVKAGLTDTTGGLLEEDFEWTFSTLPPDIVSIFPTESDYDVPLEAVIEIRFNQPMDQDSVEKAFLMVNLDNGEIVSGNFEWEDDGQLMLFEPDGLLDLESEYEIAISEKATGIGGNIPIAQSYNWTFNTVRYPAVEATYPQDGEKNVSIWSGIEIGFTAPMDEDSLEGLLVIEPALPEEAIPFYQSYGRSLSTYYRMEPSTTYTVTLLAGASDPYGNTIDQPYTFSFTTAPYDPTVRLGVLGTFGIYNANEPVELFAMYRNVSRVDFTIARLDFEEFGKLQLDYTARQSWQPPTEQLVREWSVTSTAALNEQEQTKVSLTEADGADLPPGIYLVIVDAPEVEGDIRHFAFITTDVLTFKASFDETFAWVTDIQTGQPVEGLPVQFFNENYKPLAEGVTDADGVVEIDWPHRDSLWDQSVAMLQTEDRFAISISYWSDGISPWEYGIYSDFQYNNYSLYMYTDRPLYRPGQEVFFKGILRDKDDMTYSLPQAANVKVTIYNAQGDEIYNESLPLNDIGSFDGSITLDDDAALGNYSIEVALGEITARQDFQVAEYRKPEFIVNLEPVEPEIVEGDNLEVVVDAQFYFGAPVTDAAVEWTILSAPYAFEYGGPGRYRFSDINYDEYYQEGYIPGYGTLIADGSGQTDENGQFTISLPARLEDVATSRTFTVEASVEDVNGRVVYGRAEVIVHKGEYYAGVWPERYLGSEGKEQVVSLLVVDLNDQPVPDHEVVVEVVQRRWNTVIEEDLSGRKIYTWSVEEIPVDNPTTLVTDSQGRATISFVPPEGGTYKIRATVADGQGRENSGSAFMWISSSRYVSWRLENNDRIQLVADRDTYQPGDTAEILIASPFQGDDVKALITVERGSVLSHEVINLTSNSMVYRLPITGDLAPDVYVSVVIVKGVDDTNALPSFKMGMVQLHVEPTEQTLNVTLTPDREKTGPREDVTYTVDVADYAGNPVDAEVSFALVDLSLLALSPPNSRPILDHFYGRANLGVSTAVPLILLVERVNVTLEEEAKGGGGGGQEGYYEVRGNFKDTAYWEATVRTGEDGTAKVTVTLPDNLTTWRMDARAVTEETLVGQDEVDIVTTKPLLIRPTTPRFFIVEDKVTLGAAVNNTTDEPIDALVALQATGAAVEGSLEQMVTIPANSAVQVNWPVKVAADAEWVDLTFSVQGGDLSDASKPTLGDPDHDMMLPVYKYEVPETVGTAGQLIDVGQRIEGVVLPPTYEVTQGEVTVQLDPSLAAGMLEGLDWLEHYPYECTEQTVSRFLPNALTLVAFREFDLSDPELEANLQQQIQIGLQKLYSQQHVDGGWGWWVTSPSNSTVTAYVIQGLVAAQDAGVDVENRVLDDGVAYLIDQLQPLDRLDATWQRNRQAYILYVLAKANQADVSRTVQLYEAREGMQDWAKALLAQTLWMIDEEDARLDDLQSDLISSAILSATGAHWEEDLPDWWNWNTDTRSTAVILDTFALIWPENDLAPNATRWLMVAREGGHWETTQETVWALIGLTDWMVATGELDANYDWRFEFNGAVLAEGQANSQTVDESTQITIDVADLLTEDVNRLMFSRTAGDGRLYYTAHLTAYLPVEEVEALSRGIIVSRRYLDEDGNPVTQAQVGDVVTVELNIIAPNDLYYVVVEDFYPAGAEAIDTRQLTESVLGERPTLRPDEPLFWGWGWWWFSQTELRDEKAVMFADYLPAGTYQYTYQLRMGLAGEYRVIPPTAQEFYFPEVYGRGEGSLFTVTP